MGLTALANNSLISIAVYSYSTVFAVHQTIYVIIGGREMFFAICVQSL